MTEPTATDASSGTGVHELALDIGLEILQPDLRITLLQRSEEVAERLRTVDPGFAPALQIEVGPVENQYFHGSANCPAPRGNPGTKITQASHKTMNNQ